MKKLIVFLLTGLFLFTFDQTKLWAQNPKTKKGSTLSADEKKAQEAWKKQWEEDTKKIRELLGEDTLQGLEERFGRLLDDFYKQHQGQRDRFDRFFDDDNFENFMGHLRPFDNMAEGDGHWMETPKERILIFKVKQDKDHPMDIKIKDGMVSITGKVVQENKIGGMVSKSISSFSQSYSIPEDVDQASASFDNKEGEILIKFKKLAAKKSLKDRPSIDSPAGNPALKPLRPKDGDVTI